jgi:hypothetical protein
VRLIIAETTLGPMSDDALLVIPNSPKNTTTSSASKRSLGSDRVSNTSIRINEDIIIAGQSGSDSNEVKEPNGRWNVGTKFDKDETSLTPFVSWWCKVRHHSLSISIVWSLSQPKNDIVEPKLPRIVESTTLLSAQMPISGSQVAHPILSVQSPSCITISLYSTDNL